MFTLIAHKPDSEDYCRGCRMASYPGDFEIENNLTRDTLITKWSEFGFQNEFLRCNESGYDITVLRDGVMVYQNGHIIWDGDARYVEKYGWDTGEYWEHFDEREAEESASNEEMSQIVADVAKATVTLVTAKRAKIQAEADEKTRKETELAVAQRRRQFELLEKEFGNEKTGLTVQPTDGVRV